MCYIALEGFFYWGMEACRFIAITWMLIFFSSVTYSRAKVFYVSSSEGNDVFPGTREFPKQSIRCVIQQFKEDLDIRLKCGDVFYENIIGLKNSKIRSYGRGAKPILCGFKVLRNIDSWVSMGKDIWMLEMCREDYFVGFSKEISTDTVRFNNIGCIYDSRADKIYGRIVRSLNSMQNEGDIFITEKFKKGEIHARDFGKLYIKFSKSPSTLGNLCFSVFDYGLSSMEGCLIENIAVVGFGRHGMCRMTKCIIRNCFLDIIGGAIQTDTPQWVRYGNGIEFNTSYSQPSNNLVTKCLIARVYDSATSIQGIGNKIQDVKDIKFSHNRIYHCRQAFEHFINPLGLARHPQYIRCSFSNNVCFEMGRNEFGCPEVRDANILSYERQDKEMSISGNVFYGAPYYCGYTRPLGQNNNLVYVYDGQYLNNFHAKKDYPVIVADNDTSVEKYRNWSGDISKIIIIKRGSYQDKKLKKKFLKKTGYLPNNLHLERIIE